MQRAYRLLSGQRLTAMRDAWKSIVGTGESSRNQQAQITGGNTSLATNEIYAELWQQPEAWSALFISIINVLFRRITRMIGRGNDPPFVKATQGNDKVQQPVTGKRLRGQRHDVHDRPLLAGICLEPGCTVRLLGKLFGSNRPSKLAVVSNNIYIINIMKTVNPSPIVQSFSKMKSTRRHNIIGSCRTIA